MQPIHILFFLPLFFTPTFYRLAVADELDLILFFQSSLRACPEEPRMQD